MVEQAKIQKGPSRFSLGPFLMSAFGIVLLFAVALVGIGGLVIPRIMGLQPYTIVSASMEPEYPVGGAAYVKVEPSDISAMGAAASLSSGDVVAFYRDNDVVIHRVVENNKAARELVTKGDANDTTDLFAVPYSAVIGTVEFFIPGLGVLYSALDSISGKILLCLIALLGVGLCVFARSAFSKTT